VGHEADRILFYEICEDSEDIRLDVFLASRSTDLSRSRIQTLIKSGEAKVNECRSRQSYKLKKGDRVSLLIPPASPYVLKPEPVEFGIIYEDDSLIVLNKPAGIVVHPAAGHATGTLVHGLLQHCHDLSGIGGVLRPGIVHRLDKDTSGIMVATKSDHSHAFLANQFKSGEVKKQYVALVHGVIRGNAGEIELPIGRHPKKRKQMSVRPSGGRRALTRWQKINEFNGEFSLLSVIIKTGRTHQIRVHLSHIGHPVAGDPVYGYGQRWWKRHPLYKKGVLPSIKRQMLHAKSLGFVHPDLEHYMEFEAPLPDDMANAVLILQTLNTK
jgi:23S rRNA pseudouridine1911/1915/1917 synthase